jgi:hypothetical protein
MTTDIEFRMLKTRAALAISCAVREPFASKIFSIVVDAKLWLAR